MALSFPKVGIRHNLWGGPPGPRGTPSSRGLEQENQHLAKREQADAGVGRGPGIRPTIDASVRLRENQVTLRTRARRVENPLYVRDLKLGLTRRGTLPA